MQDMLQRCDSLCGHKLTEGLEHKGKRLTYYMYEIEKFKQVIFSVKRLCVRNKNSKSTKVNTLRALYAEMFPETTPSLETTPSKSSEDKIVVGHVDTEQGSNEPILVSAHDVAEAKPSAHEVIDSDSSDIESVEVSDEEADLVLDSVETSATPQMTHEEADLVLEIESDTDDVIPGAVHVCGAPVPDALAAAAMAPLLDHAKQRKERKQQKDPKGKERKDPKGKEPAQTAPAAGRRLRGKQQAPPCKKTKKAKAPARQAPLGVPGQPQGAFRIVRSIQRELEIFSVKQGQRAPIQVTTNSAPSRMQAIQWIGILKEVLEAGATVAQARTVKDWLQQNLSDRWGNQPLHVITGGEILAYVN